ncbi:MULTISPECIES: hypothetical protein [unclassified Rathayibacter]|uniref:hypothetical protein n=1 Tax=unclassified Rathayibacter TaxID=2609250 RepID=UPI0007010F20|nr:MULTISPECIES: hypothetical protein [unclassified Rathayibacter]KQQ06253.1 hypothetical protein ASF42_07015 [Rathayibacter sp. Leaf294]KQS14108.1 hypothetical protein ASG06_07015 [Rathayibacter sp. Leaf185]
MSTIDPASPPFGDGAANFAATDTTSDDTTTATSHSTSGSGSSSTVDAAKEQAGAAKEQAASVAGDAKQAAGDVVATGKEEAATVAQEAKTQVKDLLDQSRSQLTEQAHAQKENAAKGARAFSDDLTSLANGEGGQDNMAANLVSNLAGRAQGVATWLEDREPAELLEDVKSFARRRPGAFILIAAATGLVAGRLVRALTAEAKDEKETASDTSGPEFAAPDAASYGTTNTDHLPTEPIADPLSVPPTSAGYDSFPTGTRP